MGLSSNSHVCLSCQCLHAAWGFSPFLQLSPVLTPQTGRGHQSLGQLSGWGCGTEAAGLGSSSQPGMRQGVSCSVALPVRDDPGFRSQLGLLGVVEGSRRRDDLLRRSRCLCL